MAIFALGFMLVVCGCADTSGMEWEIEMCDTSWLAIPLIILAGCIGYSICALTNWKIRNVK